MSLLKCLFGWLCRDYVHQSVAFYCTFTGEALEVKVLVLHAEHLALTWLPTLVALNQGLLCGVVVCVLRMSHCKRRDLNVTTELWCWWVIRGSLYVRGSQGSFRNISFSLFPSEDTVCRRTWICSITKAPDKDQLLRACQDLKKRKEKREHRAGQHNLRFTARWAL